MAKASSRTVSYDIESPGGERRVLLERSFIKSSRVASGYITASKQYALFDDKGRRYERVSDGLVTCVATGERFHVIGHAEKIRKAPGAG